MADRENTNGTGVSGVAYRLIFGWAMLGGFVLLLVVAINMVSVIGGFFGKPFPGDFELTEVGVAVAAFSFLPWCQLSRGNVTADIFTAGASKRTVAFFTLLGSLVALLFSLVLIWRMYAGMLDQKEYGYTTAILQFPHWMAFVPILISLALLALASAVTLREDFSTTVKG
jgi:TRAP-type C4-dicarboxylate transport system permease small subunit